MRQRTVYDAVIDKVAGYRGVAIDNAAVVVGQRAAIQDGNGLAADHSGVINVSGHNCFIIKCCAGSGIGKSSAVCVRDRNVTVCWIVLVAVLAIVAKTDGAVVNNQAIAVGQERLAVIGINIDFACGIVDNGSAVERRHAYQLIRVGPFNARISGQINHPLVNGGAAVKRHHAEPGVIDVNGAGVGGGGIAITAVGGACDHRGAGDIKFRWRPVSFVGDVIFIIQRRDKAVQVDITSVERRAFAGGYAVYPCALQIYGGAGVVTHLAVVLCQHGVQGIFVPD